MKATGIVRKIDNLGRIVIPKEIRATQKIEEGDSVEILVKETGDILIKKYDVLGNSVEMLRNVAKGLSEILKCNVIITNKEDVLKVFPEIKENIEYILDEKVKEVIEERRIYFNEKEIIVPIIVDAVTKGTLIVTAEGKRRFNENDTKIVEISSKLLEKVIS